MKLVPGDIFSIKIKNGFGFLQFIETTELGLDYVREIDTLSELGEINQEEVNRKERWNTEFPLKAAVTKKIVSKMDNFQIPTAFKVAEYARAEHRIRNKFIGWHIINRRTLQRSLKTELTPQDVQLSPYGIMNDTLIIERLEANWKLEDWK